MFEEPNYIENSKQDYLKMLRYLQKNIEVFEDERITLGERVFATYKQKLCIYIELKGTYTLDASQKRVEGENHYSLYVPNLFIDKMLKSSVETFKSSLYEFEVCGPFVKIEPTIKGRAFYIPKNELINFMSIFFDYWLTFFENADEGELEEFCGEFCGF